MKVLSIFALLALLLLGACATSTINPLHQPQENKKYDKPDGYQPAAHDSEYEHFRSVFTTIPKVWVPSNAIIQVSWDLIPENDYRKAERRNCQVHVKDEFGLESTRYRCLGVDKTSGDFIVAFEVSTENGPIVKEFNLSYMPGGFIEGNGYENPFNGVFGLRYGSYSSKELRIVWSTHKPIRWR